VLVDLGDETVGELLHVVERAALLVLGDRLSFSRLLEVGQLTSLRTLRTADARVLGVVARLLDVALATSPR
jgi:hypothetical protein